MSTTTTTTVTINNDVINKLKESLLDVNQPIAKRFRALFTLRNLNCIESINAMTEALSDKSALLRHEIAYCLGQMENEHALKVLVSLVENTQEHPMVRHEAAEALGAIGSQLALDTLKVYSKDTVPEVSETCQLALSRVEWYTINDPESIESKVYLSVDPAPSLNKSVPFEEVRKQFLNRDLDIFNRYRALFSLRDMGDEKSVLALCESFLEPSSSLLKHEVAFVLGQIQHKSAIEPLKKVLLDENENAMVRHEAAEALGAIASTETVPLLEQLVKDKEPIVSESCLIALDVTDYFNNTEEFQYADGIKILLEKNLIEKQQQQQQQENK
ncbi:PBS lyase HEAT-like repeat-containing protein [Tieghemostelium lacteum]|uniref:Deoxyhypusine hydroxylase n=1 Tax=Tieghemostelium lacteum TaxID=361077 RepID=A0A152A213_TIELA|nr:PBS lyase HEAT-like repeat-containing protein [Tieghemostelium lacteum]|eukprot:KYR00293.1 PBS lyase HEAT-like repeat-containing protein [Tieghemostelium lacteum]